MPLTEYTWDVDTRDVAGMDDEQYLLDNSESVHTTTLTDPKLIVPFRILRHLAQTDATLEEVTRTSGRTVPATLRVLRILVGLNWASCFAGNWQITTMGRRIVGDHART